MAAAPGTAIRVYAVYKSPPSRNHIVVGIGMAIMKGMNKMKDEGIIDNSEFEDIE